MSGTPTTDLPRELLDHMMAIRSKAVEYGLDFPEVIFEVLPFDTMNQVAAYGGFPTRYPHWRWGMEYERLSKRDAYGLGRIYEMVINTDPCYAYLQESNNVTDQKLVMAHVYGHADFFKNNYWFSQSNRKMMDEMANHATRVRRHVDAQGHEKVERFIDACLSLEHLIDPHAMFMNRGKAKSDTHERSGDTERTGSFEPTRFRAKSYMDPFINPQAALDRERREFDERRRHEHGRVPAEPMRDVLLFLLHHAPLEAWQQDVLAIIRDEAYYFAPQGMTKVMNEGWATYWHSMLMTRHFVDACEIVHYCDQHSGVVHMSQGGFNPYKIGVELFRDIERRWNMGQHGHVWEGLDRLGAKDAFDDQSMNGRRKIFEVRRVYNDVNFIDEFLTPELVERLDMYQYKQDPQTGERKIASRDFDRIKQTLLHHLTNMGQPFIYVVDANYLNRGELFLAHKWTGVEVDGAKASEVLANLLYIWGRPVHLQARINDEMMLITLERPGEKPKRERIRDDTPRPSHLMES